MLFTDALRFIYVQIPLAKKTEAECENAFDYWIYSLNNMETLEKMPFTDKNPAFVDLIDLATYDKMTEDEQIAYDRSLKRMWDFDAVLDGERHYAREEGIQQGIQQGVQQEKLQIAASMKRSGMPVESIMKFTGLTKEQVDSL